MRSRELVEYDGTLENSDVSYPTLKHQTVLNHKELGNKSARMG